MFSEMLFDNRKKLEFLDIFVPGGHNFDLSENLTEMVSLSFFDVLSNDFSVFLHDRV